MHPMFGASPGSSSITPGRAVSYQFVIECRYWVGSYKICEKIWDQALHWKRDASHVPRSRILEEFHYVLDGVYDDKI